jgi:hypothetical protein
MIIKCIAYHIDFIYPHDFYYWRKNFPFEVLKYDMRWQPVKYIISYVDENRKMHIIERKQKDEFPKFEMIKSDTNVSFDGNGGYTLTY